VIAPNQADDLVNYHPESQAQLISRRRRDRVGDRNRAPGHVGVQAAPPFAVELDRAARGVLRPFERGG